MSVVRRPSNQYYWSVLIRALIDVYNYGFSVTFVYSKA